MSTKNGLSKVCLGGFSFLTSVSLEEINKRVKKFKSEGYKNFEVGIDFGYYEGDEEIALYGYKDE